jgi:hypothetical protein
MKNALLLFVRILFFLVFTNLLLNHLINFQVKYIRYASLPFVLRYNLWAGYYFMIFVEALSLIAACGIKNRFVNQAYDILLFLYLLFVSVSVITIYKLSDGCIECHYFAHIVPDSPFFTLSLIWLAALSYFFILRTDASRVKTIPVNHN